MTISFLRCDDRIIHGQVVTRWAMERQCDGLIAVNDKAAKDPLIKQALKASSDKKTFVWTMEQFLSKMHEAEKSAKNYFVITKEPETMCKLLVDHDMQTNVTVLNVGPQSAKEDTFQVGKNCDVTASDVEAYQKIFDKGYEIEYQIVPDATKVKFSAVKDELLAFANK